MDTQYSGDDILKNYIKFQPPALSDNLNLQMTSWQREQLSPISSNLGIKCLLRMWFTVQPKLIEGIYCNASWDTHYCWPPTPTGETAKISCSEAFRNSHPEYAANLTGSAFRVCQENGTWLRGDWTNFSECADSYDAFVDKALMEAEENAMREKVRHIVFSGSILSLICLFAAIFIFFCFRSIWCDRIILHLHLMAALFLRYVLLYIITEPFIFNRKSNYRDEDWICKSVLILYLYATLSSVNWMFIQGVYLNGKLTTNIFDKESPLKLYSIFGWLVPIPFLGIYALLMEINHPVKCWLGYSEMTEIWIVLGPILIDLLVNVCFLLNILRVLLTTTNPTDPTSNTVEFQNFKRAAKATVILSPILGINNLLFIHNPGGAYHQAFVILNAVFSSTQGIFVALVYCYLSTDVWKAIHRSYERFLAKRNANRDIQQRRSADYRTITHVVMIGQQIYRYTRSTFFTSDFEMLSIAETHLSPMPTRTCHSHGYEIEEQRSDRNCEAVGESMCNNQRSLGVWGDLKHEIKIPSRSASVSQSLSLDGLESIV